MTRTPQGITDRALVTFVLYAYNQERFIRQAVESAFAQTYQPLEIILSDDCSIDRTFEIMREMVVTYNGPHRVRAVQTSQNLGVVQHVLLRGREAVGEIVVVAAGDDISLPHRTETLVRAFDDETGAVYSLSDIIDENGEVIEHLVERPLHLRTSDFHQQTRELMLIRRVRSKHLITQGSTSAYRSLLFRVPLSRGRKPYSEEWILGFFCHINDLVIQRIDQPLVLYRFHDGAISNRKKATGRRKSCDIETESRLGSILKRDMLKDFQLISQSVGKAGVIDVEYSSALISSEKARIDWDGYSLMTRVHQCLLRLFNYRSDRVGFRWCIARLFGRHPYYEPLGILRALSRVSRP